MKKYFILFSLGILGLIAISRFFDSVDRGTEMAAVVDLNRRQASLAVPALPAPRGTPFNAQTIAQAEQDGAMAIANQFVEAHREEWRLQPYHELRAAVFESPFSAKVAYQVYQDNLPIIGMRIVVEVDRNRKAILFESNYRSVERLDVSRVEAMTELDLIRGLGERYEERREVKELTQALNLVDARNVPDLVFVVRVLDRSLNQPAQLVLRATDGQLVQKSFAKKEF